MRITILCPVDREAECMPFGAEADTPITVYGTTWCRDCHLAKAVLELHGVGYDWVDIDQVPGAVEVVLRLNHGHRIVPTIVFPDGRILVEPSRRELEAALAGSPAGPTAA